MAFQLRIDAPVFVPGQGQCEDAAGQEALQWTPGAAGEDAHTWVLIEQCHCYMQWQQAEIASLQQRLAGLRSAIDEAHASATSATGEEGGELGATAEVSATQALCEPSLTPRSEEEKPEHTQEEKANMANAESVAAALKALFPHASVKVRDCCVEEEVGDRCIDAAVKALESFAGASLDQRALEALQLLPIADAREAIEQVQRLTAAQGGSCRNVSAAIQSACRRFQAKGKPMNHHHSWQGSRSRLSHQPPWARQHKKRRS